MPLNLISLNKMSKTILVILAVLLLNIFTAEAQCIISGNIIDPEGLPIPYATVLTENTDAPGLSMGVMADDKGYFCFRNVPAGNYLLTISTVGFETYTTSLKVSADEPQVNLPGIRLINSVTHIAEVFISGTRHVSEIKPAQIKYQTSALISEKGGTAGDILKNMPSVAMGGSPGHNRDIRFRGLGNAYTKVLINGREAGLTGNNRETILDQIPAGSISHIEIHSIPGAEYQSEGINGVVNIVLKENHDYGTHGQIEAIAGNFEGRGGTLALSNKTEKLNLYAQADFLHRDVPKWKERLKTDFKNGNISQIEDAFELEKRTFSNYNLRTGIDYFVRPKTKLSGEYLHGYQLEDKSKTLDFTRTDAAGNWRSAGQEIRSEYKPNSFHQFYTSVEHTFANQAKLSAKASYMTEDQEKTDEKTTYNLKKNGKYANFQPALENKYEATNGEKWLWNVQVNRLNLGRNSLILGYSGEQDSRTFKNTTEKFNYKDTAWVASSNGFDNFRVKETTHGFFVADEIKSGHFVMKGGLRFETTHTAGSGPTPAMSGSKTYGLFLPSASLIYNIDQSQYLSLNFGRRIRRPGFKDLNPFEEQKEPTKINAGNPDLKPERAWAYEAGYLKNFTGFNVGANLFYRDIHDVIQKTMTEDDNFVVTERPDNTGRARVMGYELMSTAQPFEFWQLTASYSRFDSKILTGEYAGDALKDQFKWTAKAITDIKLPGDWSVQAVANAVGPKISSTKIENTIWFADFGLEKKVLKNGSVNLRVSDVFDTLVKEKTDITDKSSNVETEYSRGRMFLVTMGWKF